MLLNRSVNFQGYTVSALIKTGEYAESYRVKDALGKNYFLKIIMHDKVHPSQFDTDGKLIEEYISRDINQDNLLYYRDSGSVMINDIQCVYIVYDYIAGETLAEKVTRKQYCSVYDCKRYAIGVLKGLKYLHSREIPIIHNEVTIQNVMLDMNCEPDKPVLIDMGHSRQLKSGSKLARWEDLNPFYLAPERFNGSYSISTDLYSVGVMIYHLLFGRTPWYFDTSRCETLNEVAAEVLRKKLGKIKLPDTNGIYEFDEQLLNIILRSTSPNLDERFQTASEFIDALEGNVNVGAPLSPSMHKEQRNRNIKKGNGFRDVAGMADLKEQLRSDVIDVINHPEEAKELGLSMPNGILFYGPPGCGKTFFAEKFAEEAGMNYIYAKCSDVASPYIHGGQQKIAALFDEAREKAPSIIFLDELDAMLMDRSKQNNASESGEVNEFLAQLNNCGKDNVMVIGATNNPLNIDKAALRAGRLEFKYYIPQPDHEIRKSIFEIKLSGLKTDLNIDYDKLATLTEGFVCADIKLIIENAARSVFRNHLGKIDMAILEKTISSSHPSVSPDTIKKHEAIRDEFEKGAQVVQRKKIGFK